MSEEIRDYDRINIDGEDLESEWFQYIRYVKAHKDEEPVDPISFWKGKSSVWPHLAKTALRVLNTLVSSCDAERSFSLYKHIMDDRRQSNTEEHVAQLAQLHYNGDITRSLEQASIFKP